MEISYSSLLPEILLSAFGIVTMLCVPFVRAGQQVRLGYLALTGVLAALASVPLSTRGGVAFFAMVFRDDFGQFSKVLFLVSSGVVVLVAMSYLEQENVRHGEFFALVLFATVGMCLMGTSADLIMTFLALEVLSISTYVLAGFKERDVRSGESALKYFLLGSFSTAFLLYGIAFVYGATASTKYPAIAEAIARAQIKPLTLVLGLGLLLIGLGFKIAMVPFHVWTPDVYEGAPVPVTAHLAVGSKAAAFLALTRILYQVLPELQGHWRAVLWFAAVLTMLAGNLVALAQSNVKRMLAYSSIAHAGYLLIGLIAHNRSGAQGILFYLVTYAAMTLGAFAVVQVLARKDERHVALDDYCGIGHRHPFLSASLSIFLLSLAGIPATAGFMGKFFLFAAAVEGRLYGLVIVGLLASAIGLYYYLRVIVLMYMREPTRGAEASEACPAAPVPIAIVIAIMMAVTLGVGLWPGPLLSWASEAVGF